LASKKLSFFITEGFFERFLYTYYMQIVLYAYLGLIGLCMGSFLNVLADRLSQEQTIGGRSHCDHCHKTLAWRDLVPIGSFLVSLGKCRMCRAGLSWQYPMTELLTGVAFVLGWIYSPFSSLAGHIATLSLVSVLIVIFLADIRYQIIPDETQVAGLLIGTALALLTPHLSFMTFVQMVLDGFLCMLPILLIYVLTKGRGMGFGDVKWAFVMGYILHLPYAFIALYIAFVVGGLFGVVLLLFGRAGLKQKIAFGPFLIFGFTVVYFAGTLAMDTALRLFGL
jgi:prepilin signal peptidase PulO-like enzyme (type II secretory pathway)